MDSLKEFRSMFLERYLEKNKIGRKSQSRSMSKSSSKQKPSLNKLSKSYDSKFTIKSIEDEYDDDNICKYFDFETNQSNIIQITNSDEFTKQIIKDNKHLSSSFDLINSYNSYDTIESDLAQSLNNNKLIDENVSDCLSFSFIKPLHKEEFFQQGNSFKEYLTGLFVINFLNFYLKEEQKNETLNNLNFFESNSNYNQMFISNYMIDDSNLKIFDIDSETNLF